MIDEKQFIKSVHRIRIILNDLPIRERQVFMMRFGLTDGHTHTFEEIGKKFGVTRERIRQIEAKAIAKIKSFHDIFEELDLKINVKNSKVASEKEVKLKDKKQNEQKI